MIADHASDKMLDAYLEKYTMKIGPADPKFPKGAKVLINDGDMLEDRPGVIVDDRPSADGRLKVRYAMRNSGNMDGHFLPRELKSL